MLDLKQSLTDVQHAQDRNRSALDSDIQLIILYLSSIHLNIRQLQLSSHLLECELEGNASRSENAKGKRVQMPFFKWQKDSGLKSH